MQARARVVKPNAGAADRELFAGLYQEPLHLDERIRTCDEQMDRVFKGNEVCQRLAEVEGIGPITATALVASVGDPSVFRKGRQMSAWLGLVPRQHSTGGKAVLLGISKRGDRYLRTLLIHGARSVVSRAQGKSDARSQWITRLRQRVGMNKACVALANKNARIAWALLARGERYQVAL